MNALPDYRYDPDAYELEERSRPDEMLMLECFSRLAMEFLERTPRARALDLCCGTGLSISALGDHRNLASLVGVDVCLSYLVYARERFRKSRRPPLLVLGDAPAVLGGMRPGASWDLIGMSSAYHHIDDQRKLDFLRGARSLLSPNGRIVMAENVLPRYVLGSPTSYRLAVEKFYSAVLSTMTQANLAVSSYVIDLVRRVAQYGIDGDYEYKVCMSVLLGHVEEAGLRIVSRDRVWPAVGDLEPDVGNFVFVLTTAS